MLLSEGKDYKLCWGDCNSLPVLVTKWDMGEYPNMDTDFRSGPPSSLYIKNVTSKVPPSPNSSMFFSLLPVVLFKTHTQLLSESSIAIC